MKQRDLTRLYDEKERDALRFEIVTIKSMYQVRYREALEISERARSGISAVLRKVLPAAPKKTEAQLEEEKAKRVKLIEQVKDLLFFGGNCSVKIKDEDATTANIYAADGNYNDYSIHVESAPPFVITVKEMARDEDRGEDGWKCLRILCRGTFREILDQLVRYRIELKLLGRKAGAFCPRGIRQKALDRLQEIRNFFPEEHLCETQAADLWQIVKQLEAREESQDALIAELYPRGLKNINNPVPHVDYHAELFKAAVWILRNFPFMHEVIARTITKRGDDYVVRFIGDKQQREFIISQNHPALLFCDVSLGDNLLVQAYHRMIEQDSVDDDARENLAAGFSEMLTGSFMAYGNVRTAQKTNSLTQEGKNIRLAALLDDISNRPHSYTTTVITKDNLTNPYLHPLHVYRVVSVERDERRVIIVDPSCPEEGSYRVSCDNLGNIICALQRAEATPLVYQLIVRAADLGLEDRLVETYMRVQRQDNPYSIFGLRQAKHTPQDLQNAMNAFRDYFRERCANNQNLRNTLNMFLRILREYTEELPVVVPEDF